MHDTIFALSSGSPPAAIAIVRMSGPAAFPTLEAVAGRVPAARTASVMTLRDPASATVLDRALVLAFPGPRSATGEDLVEFHLHGGRAVVRAVERVLAAQPMVREAAPGEFTRRALAAGVIDLAQAEGLGDLMLAETEAQRRAALGAVEGRTGQLVREWAQQMLGMAAQVEALLDFADADDVAADDRAVASQAGALASVMEDVGLNPPVERLRDGIRIVLAGPPNSGKSTLFNRLVDRDAAIVSPIAGTTRDRIEAPVTRDGLAFVFVDTAGLAGETDDPVERIGIDRSRAAIEEADIVLWLGNAPPATIAGTTIHIHARLDMPGRSRPAMADCAVSAITGSGMDTLWTLIADRTRCLLPRLDVATLNRRQRSLVAEAAAEMRSVAYLPDPLLMAEHLRLALRALDRIVGTIDTDAMLDALFARFCIGK